MAGDGRTRKTPDGFGDSTELDERVVPPDRAETLRPPPDSGPRDDAALSAVAVLVESPVLRRLVTDALETGMRALGGTELLPSAGMILLEPRGDVRAQLETLRATCRPDAAVLVVSPVDDPAVVAAAVRGGAFACLRPPFLPEELLGMVSAALDARAARREVARLERKLDLDEHLASLGRMSAGLSHEIGDPLGAAAMNMEAIRSECDRLVTQLRAVAYAAPSALAHEAAVARARVPAEGLPEGLAAALHDTESSLGRLRNLLQMMQGLLGAPDVRRERVQLLELVQEVRRVAASELAGVTVEVIGEPVVALADERLVEQILRNLAVNAAQAARELPSPRVRLHAYRSGRYAVASVRDNGPGIPAEQVERIFDPFYTTRRNEGRIGLGLALCREHALRMNAELSVWSLPGRGACFRLFLPLLDGA